jgi:hypothetical protein
VPRTTIAPENRVSSTTERYPKINLEKGERGRLFCFEDPWEEWVHNIRAPKIINGEPVFIKTQDRNGADTMRPDTVWISSPICLGDLGILHDKGSDPDNCPACADSQTSGDIRAPEVKYAMNVLRYALRPGSWELMTPFSMSVVAWTFPGGRYDKLLELQAITSQPATGKGAAYDVLLGPCEDKQYQKYNIAHAPEALWRRVQQAGPYIAELLKGRATEEQLADLCGSKRQRAQIIADIQSAKLLFMQSRNAGPAAQAGEDVFGTAFGGQDLAAGVNALMEQASLTAPAPASAAPAGPAFPEAPAAADPFASMVPASAIQPQAAAPAGVMTAPAIYGPGEAVPGHPGGLAEFTAPADPQMQAAAAYAQQVAQASAPVQVAPAAPPAAVLTPPAATAAPAGEDLSLEQLLGELG